MPSSTPCHHASRRLSACMMPLPLPVRRLPSPPGIIFSISRRYSQTLPFINLNPYRLSLRMTFPCLSTLLRLPTLFTVSTNISIASQILSLSASPHPRIPASPHPRLSASPHPRLSASPHPLPNVFSPTPLPLHRLSAASLSSFRSIQPTPIWSDDAHPKTPVRAQDDRGKLDPLQDKKNPWRTPCAFQGNRDIRG